MKYYRTAALVSWLIVGGALSALLISRGAYQLIPFYLIFLALGGIVPAIICAWALKVFARLTGMRWVSNWMLGGASLGVSYVIISNYIMQSVIGHVSLGSLKGFLCLVLFGPSVLSGVSYGLLIAAFAGLVNGAVLNVLWCRHLD